MRYEKKFRISRSDFPLFLSLINKLKYKKHYESRYISSIYYDTINFNLYRDSINGVSNRRKYRARERIQSRIQRERKYRERERERVLG